MTECFAVPLGEQNLFSPQLVGGSPRPVPLPVAQSSQDAHQGRVVGSGDAGGVRWGKAGWRCAAAAAGGTASYFVLERRPRPSGCLVAAVVGAAARSPIDGLEDDDEV